MNTGGFLQHVSVQRENLYKIHISNIAKEKPPCIFFLILSIHIYIFIYILPEDSPFGPQHVVDPHRINNKGPLVLMEGVFSIFLLL